MSMKIRLLSAFMAFCLMLGTISVLSALPVFAAEEESSETITDIQTGDETADSTSDDGAQSSDEGEDDPKEEKEFDILTDGYQTKQEKIDSMKLIVERFGMQMYFDSLTGEVAIRNVKTGDILFSNPYDVGGLEGTSADTKKLLLSQLIVDYTDSKGATATMYSYTEAAERHQIKMKKIKNGIRVEYIMGRQESRSLVPRLMTAERYETVIRDVITDDARRDKLDAYYTLYDPNDSDLPQSVITDMQRLFPITKQTDPSTGELYSVYAFNEDSPSAGVLSLIESIIHQYAPTYDYEQLQYDHELTGYENAETNPVQFRMALEYTLDEQGLAVRLPANGIRFDQSIYQLDNISVLPFMGAGSTENNGYVFIPDGSGALVNFDDSLRENVAASMQGAMYGQDYTYHTLRDTKNAQSMRMPIFGVVEEAKNVTVTGKNTDGTDITSTEIRKTGFLGIIEEGDSLATLVELNGMHYRNKNKYNTVYTRVNPRPKDTYSLPSAISVSSDSSYTVVSDRKYTGGYRLRYILLTDTDYAEKNGIDVDGLYDASYVGMAQAYRNRLITTGQLSAEKLTGDDLTMYLETLGAIKVNDTFLSFPITVKKPLTTCDDIKTICDELKAGGVSNLVIKLTGFANGGMENTIQNKIDIEKAVGNDSGYRELQEYADQNGIELYLDYDINYAKKDTLFDGFNKKKQAIRTIDNRYTLKRTYNATLQYFTDTGLLAVSPSEFEDIFESARGDLEDLHVKGLSLGTIGSDLNSDFDEDDPYNREDSKKNVIETLKTMREAGYSLMIDSGNAYAVSYAKHILNVALDSSKFRSTSEAVPMFGLVYHGYLNFSGTATNMAGDMRYETLKIIENGANPYFMIVYRNAEKLKEDEELNKYYSISYDNWKADIVEIYNKLNDTLGQVVGSEIVDHRFVIGERVPTEAELKQDAEDARLAEEQAQADEALRLTEEDRKNKLAEHLKGRTTGPAVVDTETEPKDTEDDTPTTDSGESADTPDAPDTPDTPDVPVTPDEPDYPRTKYTSDNGMIVKVSFENGVSFVLNYNNFDVTVEEYGETVIPALGYIFVDAAGAATAYGEEA